MADENLHTVSHLIFSVDFFVIQMFVCFFAEL